MDKRDKIVGKMVEILELSTDDYYKTLPNCSLEHIANRILECLDSQGVVLKVDGELPEIHKVYKDKGINNGIYGMALDDVLNAGYTLTEPLKGRNE